MLGLLVLPTAWAAQDASTALVMRGGVDAPKGEVVAVDRDGVSVRTAEKVVVLSWDKVVSVRGEHAAEARAVEEFAERAWRARSRLERGDYVAAEPLFEGLVTECEGRVGATSAVVAEGLLRCRLRRGVQTGAVEPWLAWLAAVGDGTMAASMDVVAAPGTPPLVDGATGLCPSVPPVWMRLPSVEALAREDASQAEERTSASSPPSKAQAPLPEDRERKGKESKADVLRRMYVVAAGFECGVRGEVVAGELPLRHPDAGVAIVAQIVAGRAGTAEVRKEARRLLGERLAQRQTQWMEAWLRVGIGRSLMRETTLEEQLLGVAEMMQVPARLRGASPYLAGVALASAAMQAAGTNPVAAWTLKKEMMDTLPGHPALDLEAVRSVRPAKAGRAAPAMPPAGGDVKEAK